MGNFDNVNFEMICPRCYALARGFQSKDGRCVQDTIEPDCVGKFYTLCKCEQWLVFSRLWPGDQPVRKKPLTREQVEALGFVLCVPPNWPSGKPNEGP